MVEVRGVEPLKDTIQRYQYFFEVYEFINDSQKAGACFSRNGRRPTPFNFSSDKLKIHTGIEPIPGCKGSSADLAQMGL